MDRVRSRSGAARLTSVKFYTDRSRTYAEIKEPWYGLNQRCVWMHLDLAVLCLVWTYDYQLSVLPVPTQPHTLMIQWTDDDISDVVIVPSGARVVSSVSPVRDELKRRYSAHMDSAKRQTVDRGRGDVLDRVLDQARSLAYVVDSFPHELSGVRMQALNEAASLWSLIKQQCEQHQANAAEQARLTAEAAAQTQGAVGVRHDGSGHFFFGGVFLVPGIPLCKDLWRMVLRHLTAAQRRKFGCVSKAFSTLSRSLFRTVTFGITGHGVQDALASCRAALRREGITDGCEPVLMLSGCREIEIKNSAYADSPMPAWFIKKVVINSIGRHVPAGQKVDLRFSGKMCVNHQTLHTAISLLVANRNAFDRVRAVIVSSLQTASIICSAVALYKLGPMNGAGQDRVYSANRSSLNKRLGELKVIIDVSERCISDDSDKAVHYALSMCEAQNPEEVGYYNCRADERAALLACMPSFFVKSVRDFELCQYLAASTMDDEAIEATLKVYVDPHGTLDPKRCETISLPRTGYGQEFDAELASARALMQAACAIH